MNPRPLKPLILDKTAVDKYTNSEYYHSLFRLLVASPQCIGSMASTLHMEKSTVSPRLLEMRTHFTCIVYQGRKYDITHVGKRLYKPTGKKVNYYRADLRTPIQGELFGEDKIKSIQGGVR